MFSVVLYAVLYRCFLRRRRWKAAAAPTAESSAAVAQRAVRLSSPVFGARPEGVCVGIGVGLILGLTVGGGVIVGVTVGGGEGGSSVTRNSVLASPSRKVTVRVCSPVASADI